MKTAFLFFLAILLHCSDASAQTLRYFEFRTQCGYNEWRDTSFIAATSDSAVIADVLNDLSKPTDQRKLIIGPIAPGNGGFNCNATHQFGWHFVPNQWHLQEMAMEVCDGCPYSDIELNPTYWLNQIGEFCPWTSAVAREVTHLVGRSETWKAEPVEFFPNPARSKITVQLPAIAGTELCLLNAVGVPVRLVRHTTELDVSGLAPGLYFLTININGKVQIQKLILEP